ncbi:MAG: hypothetical protein CM15mV12_2720 [uncultured marine virus]|nr:MAG: hypothetical protein CM15mV12_2720 [uncultured marine virus]
MSCYDAKIPKQILAEIDLWVEESRGFKDHPLATLKAHENVGYQVYDGKAHNSYQCSISPHLIEQSFWLAWVLRLTQNIGVWEKSSYFSKKMGWSL